MGETPVRRLARALVAATAVVRGEEDRRRAQLLASILLALLTLGLASGLAQLLVVPGFWGTFVYMLAALTAIGGAYWTSRTRHYRAAAWVASLAPVCACLEPLLRRLIGKHLTLVVDPGGADSVVVADRSQLEQVVLNLAVNARDAMPDGGLLKLEALHRAPAGRQSEATQWICLSVSDTGIGMDDYTVQRVCEPFFSTKGEAGHGIGLATVKGVVEQSGGRLEITSAPGHGSRFDVFLPLAPSPPHGDEGAPRLPRLAPIAGRRATILVLDDDPAVLRAVTHLLASVGYRVLSAQSAGEAIALFEAEYDRIDLLVCDLVISAIHGADVATLLVRRMPRLRVLFMSAYVDLWLDALRSLPTAEMIAKPFSLEELDAKVRHSLGVAAGRCPPQQSTLA